MTRRLGMFNNVSLDGYFTDADGDMGWAKPQGHDSEHLEFARGNTSRGATLIFGRVTYDLMAGFWPTDMARRTMPEIAAAMNAASKLVFSRALETADWDNTAILAGDPAETVARMKQEDGPDLTLLGSGRIAAQLAQANLFDTIRLMVVPVVLGAGRALFEGVTGQPRLRLAATRAFGNGSVLLTYSRA